MRRERDDEVRIVDRGRGLPEGELAPSFERFRRFAWSDGLRGRCLGPAIFRRFTEANAATFGPWSEPGASASFALAFPLARALVEGSSGDGRPGLGQ